jgi:hypothetical protein
MPNVTRRPISTYVRLSRAGGVLDYAGDATAAGATPIDAARTPRPHMQQRA